MLYAALVMMMLADTGDLVWSTNAQLSRQSDRSFTATGTRKGQRYQFRARGVCSWEPVSYWIGRHRISRIPSSPIFGIDFRASFGSDQRRILNVGSGKPEQTELTFVADRDDVTIRDWDNWDLPNRVHCTVDEIEVLLAPPE